MRIATLTCHNVYNAGASLQAYALQRYLQSLGHNVEIIDYIPQYLQHYPLWGGAYGKYSYPFIRTMFSVAKFPARLYHRVSSRRKKCFDNFTRTYLSLTKQHYSCNADIENNPPLADIYIAGSDQIWNTLFKNGRDPAFYLSFASADSIRASYAASFATDRIKAEYVSKVSNWLSKMNFIGVRETSGLQILRQLGITKGTVNVDPVFLLDHTQWEELVSPHITSLPKGRYLFVCDFEKSSLLRNIVQQIAYENNLDIITWQKLSYGNQHFWDYGPLEFLNLIRNSAYVVSNSFHATAFAIIFKKPFQVLGRVETINSRMKDLVNMLHLSSRYISDMKYERTNIEYTDVYIYLDQMIHESKVYLENIINSSFKQETCHG